MRRRGLPGRARDVRCAQAVRPGCGPACQRPASAAVTVTRASSSCPLSFRVASLSRLRPVSPPAGRLVTERSAGAAPATALRGPGQSGLGYVGHASRQCPWRLSGRQSRQPLVVQEWPTGRQSRQPRVPRYRRRAGCQSRRPSVRSANFARRLAALESRQRPEFASGSGPGPVPGAFCAVMSHSRPGPGRRLPKVDGFVTGDGRSSGRVVGTGALRGGTACFVRVTPPSGTLTHPNSYMNS